VEVLMKRFETDFAYAPPTICFQLTRVLLQYHVTKPVIHRSMFFPCRQNEKELAYVLRRATKKMDISVFAFTNDELREALLYAHHKGVKIRIIGDDECAKFNGAEIFRLCLEGIEATTDDNFRAHMHNKYVLIDD